MYECRPSAILALLALTLLAPAAASAGDLAGGDLFAGGGCAAQPTGLPAAAGPAPLVFYSIPDASLGEARSRVEAEVRVDGERFVVERFEVTAGAIEAARERDRAALRASVPEGPSGLAGAARTPDAVVFELLGDRPELRARLHELAAERRAIAVEVTVDGRSVLYRTLDELAAAGPELLAVAGPPVAVDAAAQAFAASFLGAEPQRFYVCGDGSCGGGTPPLGENCESCPQDCGGSCSICGNGFCGGTETCSTCSADCGACPSCPESLGIEERTDWLGGTPISTYCMDAWPGRLYYTYTRNDYKRYDVERIRQCNGTITETVVPGSTTYFSAYCWKYTGVPCSFSFGSAFPVCF